KIPTYHVSSQVNTQNSDCAQRKRNVSKVLYLDSSTSALAHCIRYGSTRRVNHCHESNKAQVLSGKVQLFSIKCKALWELQMVEVEPSVSTASRFFTRQFFLAIRFAVRVRQTYSKQKIDID
uniref:Uncharacterized protein n=1 Tax=Pygocentrus nattereri TaxID=42514 RepID=A0AAR2J9I1_PYGNA